jgi:hypothetical protein
VEAPAAAVPEVREVREERPPRREERRDERREGGNNRRERDRDRREERVVGMGDHVPDFLLRSFRIPSLTASDEEEPVPEAAEEMLAGDGEA